MKKLWIILTRSDSSDDYYYLIAHPQKPTDSELKLFLSKHGCDIDEETCYESVYIIDQIRQEDALSIPKSGKILEFI